MLLGSEWSFLEGFEHKLNFKLHHRHLRLARDHGASEDAKRWRRSSGHALSEYDARRIQRFRDCRV